MGFGVIVTFRVSINAVASMTSTVAALEVMCLPLWACTWLMKAVRILIAALRFPPFIEV